MWNLLHEVYAPFSRIALEPKQHAEMAMREKGMGETLTVKQATKQHAVWVSRAPMQQGWRVILQEGCEIFYFPKFPLPVGSDSKASACNVGDQGSIPGSGRSAGEGNGNPLQHSCLENPMDGGAW